MNRKSRMNSDQTSHCFRPRLEPRRRAEVSKCGSFEVLEVKARASHGLPSDQIFLWSSELWFHQYHRISEPYRPIAASRRGRSSIQTVPLPGKMNSSKDQRLQAWRRLRWNLFRLRSESVHLVVRSLYGRSEKRSEEHTSELQSRLHLVCR